VGVIRESITYKVLLLSSIFQSNIATKAYFINNIDSFSVDSFLNTTSNMSACATSSTPSNAPTPYEDENPSPDYFSSEPGQDDSKTPLESTSHESTASISPGLSSKPAPRGLFAKLKEKKDVLAKNFNEGVARGQSDEGVKLANHWNSQHESVCFGLPETSSEKWQEHEDKKQAK
jgi:hypothetical protein